MEDVGGSTRSEGDLITIAQTSTPAALDARRQLIEAHEPHIESILVRLRVKGRDQEDARQAARLGLLVAISRYIPARGATLRTFAYPFMLGEVVRALYGRGPNGGGIQLVPFDEAFIPGEDRLAEVEDVITVRQFVASLAAIDRAIVTAMYWDGATQAEVARMFGMTRVQVHRRVRHVFGHGRLALGAA